MSFLSVMLVMTMFIEVPVFVISYAQEHNVGNDSDTCIDIGSIDSQGGFADFKSALGETPAVYNSPEFEHAVAF